jgi:sulfatase modifying factor 1
MIERPRGDADHPVEGLSLEQILPMLARGIGYGAMQLRLPSEAEWEYACRASTDGAYSFGAEMEGEAQCNHESVPVLSKSFGAETLSAVDDSNAIGVRDIAPNPWGLYQMHGNVWEWCADAPRTYSAMAVVDPVLPHDANTSGANGVLRGGGWFSFALSARSAFRFRVAPDGQDFSAGFRLAWRALF